MMKQTETDPPELPASVVACAIIAALMVIVASFSIEESQFVRWVDQYQTLLTGLFAVGAAWATVTQMQSSERLQQKRHEQLIELSVRAERRCLLAAADRYPRLLWDLDDRFTTISDRASEADDDELEVDHQEVLEMASSTFADIKLLLGEPSMERAKDLFEPELFNAYTELSDVANRYATWHEGAIAALKGPHHAFYRYEFMQFIDEASGYLDYMVKELRKQAVVLRG